MVFSSLTFLSIFLPIVLILHHILPTIKLKNTMLIITSLIFYAYGEPVFVILVFVSTIVNYLFGLGLQHRNAVVCKTLLTLSIIFNLGLLMVFKYTGMIVGTINEIFSTNITVGAILLPIGISFYTFQSISYTVDAYRKIIEVQKNYFNFLLFIALFPQKIAGPIEKYHDIAPQLTNRIVTTGKFIEGMKRFVIGLAKKVLISNAVALIADNVFYADPGQVNALAAWAGALAYMMQIYFDFSGYSDMAVGLGKMMGFKFVENFNYPYGATSIQEFWRKWHISLSNWFKEYVYIPLGGNRKGKARTSTNKIIVFFLTGLWHGANWSFVVWGLIHGVFLLIEEYIPIKKLPTVLARIYTLMVVCLTFVIFRAETLTEGVTIIAKMFTDWNFAPEQMNFFIRQMTPMFIVALIAGVLGCVPHYRKVLSKIERYEWGHKVIHNATYVWTFVILLASMLHLASGGYNPFIYFRF